MSYIDTIDHELVGVFAGIPVYHPLETITGNPPSSRDFNCSPQQLVIGGGGGEHPGLVLQRPYCAIASFIDTWLDQKSDPNPQAMTDNLQALQATWATFVDDLVAVAFDEIWHFAGWSVPRYAQFYERCQSAALCTPFDPQQDESFEQWLTASFGEFVFFALPELVPDLSARLPGARATIRQALYVNILIPPPGYGLPYGRTRVNGQVTWGNLRWK